MRHAVFGLVRNDAAGRGVGGAMLEQAFLKIDFQPVAFGGSYCMFVGLELPDQEPLPFSAGEVSGVLGPKDVIVQPDSILFSAPIKAVATACCHCLESGVDRLPTLERDQVRVPLVIAGRDVSHPFRFGGVGIGCSYGSRSQEQSGDQSQNGGDVSALGAMNHLWRTG